MEMELAYQKPAKDCLPNVDVVFDRFHVMKNYSKAIQNQRRIEFRKADAKNKDLIKGSLYLLLRNADKLNDKQSDKIENLIEKIASVLGTKEK